MTDEELRARLGELPQLPLDAHPQVLEAVQREIESELEELRRQIPSGPANGASPR